MENEARHIYFGLLEVRGMFSIALI
ncbi:hypothetical protein NTGBS_440038 [Candidatus Nitrotoga sp. BS]|nr:hypothetical protein NTGBS_440038 [Candidatus Nitrotoga sp. BS]